MDSIESLDHLIKESERYWSINRKVSDSLISRAFTIIENKKISDSVLLAEAYHILGKNLINKREYQSGIDTFKKCNLIKQLSKEDSKSISKTP